MTPRQEARNLLIVGAAVAVVGLAFAAGRRSRGREVQRLHGALLVERRRDGAGYQRGWDDHAEMAAGGAAPRLRSPSRRSKPATSVHIRTQKAEGVIIMWVVEELRQGCWVPCSHQVSEPEARMAERLLRFDRPWRPYRVVRV